MAQIHKRFSDEQVRDLFKRYVRREVERKYLQEILGVSKSRFFILLEKYRKSPEKFSVQYSRSVPTRQIDPAVEVNILKELATDKEMILNKEIPIYRYNYSFVKGELESKYKQSVSLGTIIDRAKKHDFYISDARKGKIHDREVLTQYTGQLIQHDSSYHMWAPGADEKWWLITGLDDYSRFMFYALLLKREQVWPHIEALQRLVLEHGYPYQYYVDQHSIFRFVRNRDDRYYKKGPITDDYLPQWKQVMNDCGVKVIYALSPQAKGKIERPYGWLQDHLVRRCVRENIATIQPARKILADEVGQYNYKRVHSTTGEIPYIRFQRALKERQSLFREFKLPPPFKSPKDLFCLRLHRTTDAYRKVAINNIPVKVNGVDPHEALTIRVYPLSPAVSELRFWHEKRLVDVQTFKNRDLKGVFGGVHF
jgi:hypothetical protein